MSRIRSKNTLLELLGFNILKKTGAKFRQHPKGIYGKPDAALKNRRIAVFFDSDFWHGFDFNNTLKQRLPNEYWINRIEKNIQRDNEVTFFLRDKGWIVIRLWEHDIEKDREGCLNKIVSALKTTHPKNKKNNE